MQRGAKGAAMCHSLSISLAVLIAALFLLSGCSKGAKPVAEAPPALSASTTDQPQQTAKLPAPQTNEVQEAVKRVFKDAVLIDTSLQPNFIVGDFNGDGSQDIAVALKPASDKLAELNEEFPKWILRDIAGPNATVATSTGPRLRVGANDKLLAIIHGYDAKGWRDEQATQTYLLKNAAGSRLEAYSGKDFAASHRNWKLPRLRGDVVAVQRSAKSGYLYYANATYAWYDPTTFSEEPERRVAHMTPKEKK